MTNTNTFLSEEQMQVVELELKRGLTLFLRNDPKPKYVLYPLYDNLVVRDDFDNNQTYRVYRINYKHIDMDKYVKDAVDYTVFHSVFSDEHEVAILNRTEMLSYINYWKVHFLNWIGLMLDLKISSVKFKRHMVIHFVKITNYVAFDGNTYMGYGAIIKFYYEVDGQIMSNRFFVPVYLSGMDVFHDNKAIFDLDVILYFMFEVPYNRYIRFDTKRSFIQNYTQKEVSLIFEKWV